MSATREAEFRVAVSHDYDGDCSVDVTMVAGAFQGTGHAWLNILDISDFARAVQQLASTSKGNAVLRGGYTDKDGSAHHTIDINLKPHGSRGHLIVAGELASDPPSLDAKIFVVSRMSGGIIVEPAALASFAEKLMDIPKGSGREAVVRGDSAA